jgi:polar amino acid transport system permease protein
MLWSYRWLLAGGLLTTILYTIGTVFAGLIVGLAVGLGRSILRPIYAFPLQLYLGLFRCTPLLVQIVWFYYALPVLIGVNIPASVACGISLTLYTGAFYAEIFRGGIDAIDVGQTEAGRAIGMRRFKIFRRIILPQAIRVMVPAFINQTVMQLKNTSLVSTLAVGDLLYQGSLITAETYRPLEVYTAVAMIYFAVLFPLTLAAEAADRRMGKHK